MGLDREIAYLCEAIGPPSARPRIVDLGSSGRRAVALALRGYSMTVIGHSSAALADARTAAANAGVSVDFIDFNLLDLEALLPVSEFDAAIAIPFRYQGNDNDCLRLLRTLRAGLNDRGLFILDHVNPMWFAGHHSDAGSYDLVEGRCRSQAENPPEGDGWRTGKHDVRLYTVPELTNLLRTCGFEIGRIDAEFTARRVPTPDSRSVQIVAAAAPVPPASLSIGFHQPEIETPALNLKWSPDEVEWLEPSPEKIWAPMFARGIGAIAQVARDYALTDPWGERAAAVLSSHFGVALSPDSIVFGAGATGLLREIAPMVRGGCVLTPPLVHRDFPLWAAAEGARIEWLAGACDSRHSQELISRIAPDLVYLDRPTASGSIIPLESIVRLCRQAQQQRCLVAIDEAYLAYFAGANSAVCLTREIDNLIVIRSLSKAYCCGGLRVGFAVSGKIAAPMLRRFVAPIPVSELAFQMGLRLLEAGDIFGKLRRRIKQAKGTMTGLLVQAGLNVTPGNENLPWVLVEDVTGAVRAQFLETGIAGKRLVPFHPSAASGNAWLRLSVPLSDERLSEFEHLIGNRDHRSSAAEVR
jgi:histidinol-phosphate/aromatic aminotransferase/cobyric acid decarboxylase-like protein